MNKMIALVLVTLSILCCFAGCTSPGPDSDLAYIQEKGKLIVGITEYAPMDYKDDNGNWIGFDAEFARLFAQELGVEVEFYIIADWDKKFMELDTKQIDVVWNGMTITDEATSNSSVSDPYVINAQVVVMKSDVVGNFTTADSLKGLTIAVERGSAGEKAANAIKGVTVVPLQDQAAALMEVKAGTADACVIDITMAYAMTGEGTNYADLAPGISLTEEFYGVSFRKGSDLTAMLNDFMAKLKADGTLQNLARKYNLTLTD
jgi:polar amino acid transport system substrate-binding protein